MSKHPSSNPYSLLQPSSGSTLKRIAANGTKPGIQAVLAVTFWVTAVAVHEVGGASSVAMLALILLMGTTLLGQSELLHRKQSAEVPASQDKV